MKKYIFALALVFVITIPSGFAHALTSEIHVTRDGKTTVSDAKVMQIAGDTFFTRLYWGDSYIRLTVKTNSKTTFARATGESTTSKEIHVGDFLEMTGELESRSDTLTLVASSIKNASVQKEQTTVSGTVVGVDVGKQQFSLSDKTRGTLTVTTNGATLFFKGSRIIDLARVRIGDRIISVSGDYDIPTKALVSNSPVTVYIDMNSFKPKLYTGTLAEKPALDATSLKVTIDKKVYTIALNNKTEIMRKSRDAVTLERFVVGDFIRLYGALREVDEPIIDAEVVRNMNL